MEREMEGDVSHAPTAVLGRGCRYR